MIAKGAMGVANGDCTPASASRNTKRARAIWMAGAAIVAVLVMVSIVRPLATARDDGAVGPAAHKPTAPAAVTIVGPGELELAPDTPLEHNLKTITLAAEKISYPLLRVTGSVIARIRAGKEPIEDRWQFATQELSTTYADWLKAKSDIEFAENRSKRVNELATAQAHRFETVVSRLRNLAGGTVAVKELLAAEADLVQAQLQGQKDVYEAETGVRLARRQYAALERQLSQVGLEPVVLTRAREGMVLIVANVPESRVSLAHEGQSCAARFYGFPSVVFSAHVEHLGSVLTADRRTLRVLFDLDDLEYRLRPGMFGEIGLGTDEREALVAPATAIIHIGRIDYILRRKDERRLEAVSVKTSESWANRMEVLSGLSAGDRIVAEGAILLKPPLVNSMVRH